MAPRRKATKKAIRGGGKDLPERAPSCSVSRREKNDFTCMTDEELDMIYRKTFKREPAIGATKEDKWLLLRDHFKPRCGDNEFCWLARVAKDSRDEACEVLDKAFVPEGPYTGTKWLSGLDIDNVMKQYVVKYSHFVWGECHPIDFSYASDIRYYGDVGVIRETELLDLYRSGKTMFAVVLNLDKHTGPGSHWCSVVLNMTTLGTREDPWWFEWYDPVGNNERRKVPPEVLEWANTFAIIALLGVGKFCRFVYSGINHQQGNDLCGVYSCHFIDRRLAGVSFEDYCRNVTRDAEMRKFRKVFFRPKA
jgi:hypothetical protein